MSDPGRPGYSRAPDHVSIPSDTPKVSSPNLNPNDLKFVNVLHNSSRFSPPVRGRQVTLDDPPSGKDGWVDWMDGWMDGLEGWMDR